MHRSLVSLLALGLATCQPADQWIAPSTDSADTATALLALDLDAALAAGTSMTPQGEPHTAVELNVDGAMVATLPLPAEGELLQGRAAWPIPADRAVTVSLTLVGGSKHARSASLQLEAMPDAVVLVRARPSKVAAEADKSSITLEQEGDGRLEEDTAAAIDYADTRRGQAHLQRIGRNPVTAIAAILRDPQVAVLTPHPSRDTNEGHIGPLVAFQAIERSKSPQPAAHQRSNADLAQAPRAPENAENAALQRDPSSPTPTIDPAPILPATTRPAPVTRRDPVTANPAFIYYYSYCSCGKPVVDRAYTLTGKSVAGADLRQTGHTDFFGMVHARDVDDAKLNFGNGQRARKRSYAFVEGTEQGRHDVLSALGHGDPNEVLTGLLDIRRAPLPEAKERLVKLLDADNEVVWRNAAVSLGYYDDVDTLVQDHADALMQGGKNTEKTAFILGALRRRTALPALVVGLKSHNAALRRVSAWAVGFIADQDGVELLAALAKDPNPMVRAEVALALGRIGDKTALGLLEDLQGDVAAMVTTRAQDAIGRVTR